MDCRLAEYPVRHRVNTGSDRGERWRDCHAANKSLHKRWLLLLRSVGNRLSSGQDPEPVVLHIAGRGEFYLSRIRLDRKGQTETGRNSRRRQFWSKSLRMSQIV